MYHCYKCGGVVHPALYPYVVLFEEHAGKTLTYKEIDEKVGKKRTESTISKVRSISPHLVIKTIMGVGVRIQKKRERIECKKKCNKCLTSEAKKRVVVYKRMNEYNRANPSMITAPIVGGCVFDKAASTHNTTEGYEVLRFTR